MRVVVATGLWLAVHGCTGGDGGAVELSWRLRPSSSSLPDKFVDCAANGAPGTRPVTRVRLEWESEGEIGSTSWNCGDNHGITGFDLQPGSALLSVVPMCDGRDALPGTYITPAPQQRAVIAGETISLGAIEIVLQVNNCDIQDCICE